MERQKHLLVVLPHPDDESNMSGTLAWHIHHGTPVTYVCLTLGEMGRNMGNPIIANRASLPEIRKQELEASCRSIGIQDLRMWGYRDKTIEFEDQEALISRINGVIAELKPTLIITFYPGYSVHPDHDACGAAVIQAVQRLPQDERPTVHCVAFSAGCEDVLGPPDVMNEVSEFYEQKVGSFQAHKSQFQIMVGSRSFDDPQVKAYWGTERFWTYRFKDE
ncbi:bacillithiol biosynthesis deacetylase BshB2 [Marinicrinis lubricantis]|uniref:Bacillithiol biosynthesis deacetylase BshB2 n=1 Tax=Marinicrinis lubricantis TaxID=2086470 RepID=A0ABW1IR11_9BACL